MLILAVSSAILILIASLISSAITDLVLHNPGTTVGLGFLSTGLAIGLSFAEILLVPISFFIGVGILFLLAKAFKGEGTFLVQSYSTLLYQVPISLLVLLITALFSLIPIFGSLIASLITLPITIYTIVLEVFQIMSTHRLSGGKATWVVLIPLIVGIVLGVICGIVFVGIFIATFTHATNTTTYP